MDSVVENGVAGLPDGDLHFYYLDTFGAHFRGRCGRSDVSLSAHDWPRCRKAFLDEIDLRTGKALIERARLAHEDPWPEFCAQRALQAPRGDGIVFKLTSGTNPIPNPEQWGLSCREATPTFEMLVDATGRVVCARVIEVGRKPPRPGLHDSIRMQLVRWRFDPPTLHGRPVEMRWGMHINPVKSSDELPGPPIYPVCR